MTEKIRIGPSLLAANPLNLEYALNCIHETDANYLHCDVMDGIYVPNFGLSLNVIEKIRDYSSLPIDVHFMTQKMDLPLSWSMNFKPHSISFHPETVSHVHRYVESLKSKGIRVGLAFNPSTSIKILDEIHDLLDHVLVMGVNPGFCGQQFISSTCSKITRIKQNFPSLPIQVDGAISLETIQPCFASGATSFVCGSSLFSNVFHENSASEFPKKNIDFLQSQIQALRQSTETL
ncbi:MAG: ribulose-phosphate 3-epimerase [Candidatus Puniceispirillum sp.]|nr:ribulose-phosphate 3-epimerase [Candidatus Pelagibacter sp.]MBA4283133.1 ribulose-phosphate 3-epimerase [Candidatus Puniceispirillum sp.]